jgi:hypothetical protein
VKGLVSFVIIFGKVPPARLLPSYANNRQFKQSTVKQVACDPVDMPRPLKCQKASQSRVVLKPQVLVTRNVAY